MHGVGQLQLVQEIGVWSRLVGGQHAVSLLISYNTIRPARRAIACSGLHTAVWNFFERRNWSVVS